NAKSDSYASEVGLGWSLMAGGSITRTVIDGIDEMRYLIRSSASGPPHKYMAGIFFDTPSSQTPDVLDYASQIINSQSLTPDILNAFAFESTYLNKYDTKYDLYQYNFMNYTGRFFVQKNG